MSTDINAIAIRSLNQRAQWDRAELARAAGSLAADLERFAGDVDAGLATGLHSRIAQEATQLLISAVDLKAKSETISIFAADRATEK
ncbi:hypothetical protein ACIQVK_19355 [Streptomyces sp. NPDC090493]|uniref:hypothetical protein n=1 Tax=Streptomyces sp. NPDC090493 TaxID=3365964 RepID=UPI0038102235